MGNKSAILTIVILTFMIFSQTTKSQVIFGIFADCQYCDCETVNSRFYRNSAEKLEESIHYFNQDKNIEFVVGLGDLIDRDFSSYDTLIPILNQSKHKIYHVVGNHDLEVKSEFLEKVPQKLGLKKNWYSIEKDGWLFVFLDGNDITFHSNNEEVTKQAETITTKLKNENKPNFHEWNGGIGNEQLSWMESQLQNAENNNLKVIIFCHYPLLPFEMHALWNSGEVLDVLKKYSSVKLWMNGHNHAGNYTNWEGIHFLNLKGMVETENINTYSVVKLFSNKIEIKGFGNESAQTLGFE